MADSIAAIIRNGYGKLIESRLAEGWDGYLMTFMFSKLRGSRYSVLRQMQREVERVYATALTRIVRHPTSPRNVGKLPIWLVCPDYPVPKGERDRLRDIALNDGLHMHGIAVLPPDNRLQVGLDDHLEECQGLYIGNRGELLRVDAKPIVSNPAYVTEYVLKSVQRQRVSLDDVIVLPRVLSELA